MATDESRLALPGSGVREADRHHGRRDRRQLSPAHSATIDGPCIGFVTPACADHEFELLTGLGDTEGGGRVRGDGHQREPEPVAENRVPETTSMR